jgi:hypothetical protein
MTVEMKDKIRGREIGEPIYEEDVKSIQKAVRLETLKEVQKKADILNCMPLSVNKNVCFLDWLSAQIKELGGKE